MKHTKALKYVQKHVTPKMTKTFDEKDVSIQPLKTMMMDDEDSMTEIDPTPCPCGNCPECQDGRYKVQEQSQSGVECLLLASELVG